MVLQYIKQKKELDSRKYKDVCTSIRNSKKKKKKQTPKANREVRVEYFSQSG